MKYASRMVILLAVAALIGCGGPSAVTGPATPEAQAQIKANDEAVQQSESAVQQTGQQ